MPRKENIFECSAVTGGIEIELTNHCGMNCIVCPRKELGSFGFISKENFAKAVDILEEGNFSEIMVCGLGDAFLHPDLNDLMEYLFSRLPKIKLFFMTKGLGIKHHHLEKIKELNDRGFNVSLTFSVFSLNEELFNYLSGGDFYKGFLKSLNSSKKSGVNFSMELMLSTKNLGEMAKFKAFAERLGVDYGISLVHNWGGRISEEIHSKLFSNESLKDYHVIRGKGDVCEVMKYDYLYINSSGKVLQCSLNELDGKGYLGKLGEHNLRGLLEKKKALDYEMLCKNCFYHSNKTFS